MSNIDLDSILELSCLSLTDERKQAFVGQIEKVLDYMVVLNNVETTPDPSFEWPIHKDVIGREDVPESFEHPLVKENAPVYKSGGFSVPKILS
jgi:aspartyl/glutamyl-tRNA(Asn/Gln) amidotransferase C subunit